MPLGDSWRQTDTIARTIHDAFERYFAMKAGQPLDSRKLSKAGDYVPQLRVVKRSTIQVDHAAIAAHQQQTEQLYGHDR